MNKLPKSRSGALYLDFQDVARAITDDDWQFQQFSQLKAYKGMGVSLSFVDEGVRIDYALAYDPEKMPAGSQDTARSPASLKKANEIVPNDAIAYLGFSEFRKNIEDFLSEVRSQPAFDDFNEELYYFERESGISLESDILSWMKGEVAFGICSDRNGLFGARDVPLGVLALFAAGDPQAVGSKMRKITGLLAREGLRVYDGTLNGQEIHYLLDPYTGDFIGGYGIRDGYLVIGTSRQMLEKAMGADKEVLASSAAFKKATANLPSPQDNLIYLDVEKGVKLVSDTLFEFDRDAYREFNRDVYPFIKPVKSISLASQEMKSKDNFTTGAAIINIER
ncbi:DUF3352 domain-containing protein [Desulfofundulus luciae]|uniref:DUF3352 domain-containing protein n=1 Tax=Desulfofundulus luciae TaxID=74702 RepID=UPI0027D88192|nr:DUF3352 domain-containing protein [Desulfofundulus luciae]